MKESLEPLINLSLLGKVVAGLVVKGDTVHWVLFAIIHHFLVGVIDRRPDLQALKLIGRLESATIGRILGGGHLSKRTGSCPLGKLLRVSGGSLA
jgi:hypothetical protein